MSNKMDIKGSNIIEIIKKGSTNKSQYMLRKEQLKKLLEPIKNTEVVVIAVVGQSRRGKSFLLNYMCRFLADYKNINGWMGDGNKALEGFGWKSCADPQTFGLWLSKPFIVKQSNGKEMAVLLMDTQGLFDDLYTQRDWSTIVGISLLVSSCLIVNVFTDISDDILTTFNSYIDYGLKAAETNSGTNESIPFQTLLFLIRDWNTPNQYKFGLTGGKQYLEKKLIVRDNQSAVAQNVRKNIQKCFKDFLCFLMPPFGEVMEREDFNGSFGQLRDRFKEKLKEFISTLLNPEELVPKMIDGNPITGEELFQQFQALVEIFNREELPESHQILEAKAKLSDSIVIRKLRDLHLTQLRAFIQTKPFITRNDLKERNEFYKTEIIEEFETSMKSNNTKLVDKLYDILKTNFEIVFKENEEKRGQYVEEKRDLCGKEFMEALNKELQNNGFIESQTLEELFKTLEKKAFNSFNQCFCGEVKNLFERDLYELTMFINHFEKVTRAENYRRIRELEKSKESFIENVVQFYNENMKKLLEDNIYLSKEYFKETEKVIRNKTDSKFRKEYNFGNPSANETFFLKVDQKLNESKSCFKEKNQIKCENVLKDTQTVVSNSIENYRKEMEERLYSINPVEDLEKSHTIVLKKVSEDMQNRLEEMVKYFNIFNTDEMPESHQLLEATAEVHDNIAIIKLKDLHLSQLRAFIQTKPFITRNDLKERNEVYKTEIIEEFETSMKSNNTKLVDKLYDILKINFENTCKENEEKRRLFVEEKRDLCGKEFMDALNKELQNNGFIESQTLEELFKTLEKKAFNSFNQCFCGEIKDLFERELFELTIFINQLEKSARTDNNRRIRELLESNEILFGNMIQLYKENMNNVLEDNIYLSKEFIKEIEKNQQSFVRRENIFGENEFNKTSSINKSDTKKGNLFSDKQTYFLNSKQNIVEEFLKSKEEFQIKYKLNCLVIDFQKMYEDDMKETINNVRNIKELKDCHQNVKLKLIRIFKESYRFRDESEFTPYIERLKESFEQSLADFEVILDFKIKDKETETKILMINIRQYYKEEMSKFFQNKVFVQKPVLIKCHNFSISNTIEKFRPEKGELTEESFKQLVEESITDIFAKIEEENQMKRPTESPAIGIDLGTTND